MDPEVRLKGVPSEVVQVFLNHVKRKLFVAVKSLGVSAMNVRGSGGILPREFFLSFRILDQL